MPEAHRVQMKVLILGQRQDRVIKKWKEKHMWSEDLVLPNSPGDSIKMILCQDVQCYEKYRIMAYM